MEPTSTKIYTLSLHDALPIYRGHQARPGCQPARSSLSDHRSALPPPPLDRKSTRLNSSHSQISYAVFCLKKKTATLKIPESYQFNLGFEREIHKAFVFDVNYT